MEVIEVPLHGVGPNFVSELEVLVRDSFVEVAGAPGPVVIKDALTVVSW